MNDPTLPFDDLPDAPKREWRKYTAANWELAHPEQAEYCLHLVREELILNVKVLAERVAAQFGRAYNGGLRNVITAFLSRKLTKEERDSIQSAKLFFTRAALIDKTHDLADKSEAKGDLGAVAMAMKLTHDVGMASAPAEGEVKKRKVVDLEAVRARVRQKAMEAKDALALPAPVIIDLPATPVTTSDTAA